MDQFNDRYSHARAAFRAPETTVFAIIFAVSFCHLLNDMMQSLLAAIYPMLKENYGLNFKQIGILTLIFQGTASLLQPLVGTYTDKRPMPYSLPVGMAFSLAGLATLSFATHYAMLLVGAALIGIGSSIFHPESSRVARLASGGRHGLAAVAFSGWWKFRHSPWPIAGRLYRFALWPKEHYLVLGRCTAWHDHSLSCG